MTAPFWLSTLPPLADFPGHIGQYHIMLDLQRSQYLQRFYDFRWSLVGNLGGELLMVVLGPFLGVERGAWAIAAITPGLMVLGILAVSHTIHGRVQPYAFLALPFVYASAFRWGFLNYDLSVVLALFAFALWVRWRRKPKYRAFAFVLISFSVWVCHAAGWAVLCVLVVGYELGLRLSKGKFQFAALGQSALVALPLMGPALLSSRMVHLSSTPQAYTVATSNFASGYIPYKLVIFFGQLNDQFLVLDAASVFIIAGLYVVGRLRGVSLLPGLALPAALLGLVALILPPVVSGSALADFRIVPVAFIFLFLSMKNDPTRKGALIVASVLALTALRLGATAYGWHQETLTFERHLSALKYVPMGARILVVVPTGEGASYQKRMGHLADYAIARRDALVNTQWVNTGAILADVKANSDIPYYSDPSQYVRRDEVQDVLATAKRDHFDFVWVLGRYPPGSLPRNLSLNYADEETRLFRIVR